MKESNKVLLTEAPGKLRIAAEQTMGVPYQICDLVDYMAETGKDEFSASELILALETALADLRDEHNLLTSHEKIPEFLIAEREKIFKKLEYFPLIIDHIASKEFSREFREIFIKCFGPAKEPQE